MNKSDINTFKRGFRRTVLALLTAAFFVLGVCGLIKTASVPGYLAVITFIASLASMFASLVCMFAQGVTITGKTESGDDE